MAEILALPGLAHLKTTDGGKIVVAFDGQSFSSEEILPTTLLSRVDCPTPPCTARAYVLHFMTRQFGYHREYWPQIAQDYAAQAPGVDSISAAKRYTIQRADDDQLSGKSSIREQHSCAFSPLLLDPPMRRFCEHLDILH